MSISSVQQGTNFHRPSDTPEVSADDVHIAVDKLEGSRRTGTAVALRSLFAALKAARMVFADPTRTVRPGRFPQRPVLGLDPCTRTGLIGDVVRADHRLVLLLAGVHALSRADIAGLQLDHVHLATRTIEVRGHRRGLDELTYHSLVEWLDRRRRRWPITANPHVLLTARSAYGLGSVSGSYFKGVFENLSTSVSKLRADRLLAGAVDTGGDPLHLQRLFNISADTAVRYCTELDLTNAGHPMGDPIDPTEP